VRQAENGLVACRPANFWIQHFNDCHEWHWDGGTLPAKRGKNSAIRGGFYHRIEWPDPGGVREQANLMVEAFSVIRDEEARMLAEQVK